MGAPPTMAAIAALLPDGWLPLAIRCLVAMACVALATALLKRRSYPQPVPGLPLLGNALALGVHGVAYIRACRRQVGGGRPMPARRPVTVQRPISCCTHHPPPTVYLMLRAPPSSLQYGDTFTLNLAGQRMVFLHDLQHVEAFFKAPDAEITFR